MSYHQSHQLESCVLFANPDQSVVLIDVPRSIEEAQVLPWQHVDRRILSSCPIKTPWVTPEPKKGLRQPVTISPSAAIAELMTLERVRAAVELVRSSHTGPWCLPRICEPTGNKCDNDDEAGGKVSRKRKQTSPEPKAAASDAPPLVPAQAHYLLGTIDAQRDSFLKRAPEFDLIVLDPPWPSRSVRRKTDGYSTVYGMEEARDLLAHIPISAHLKPNGLVAIWVTNKATVTDLLTSPSDGMFSQWGLEPIGEWVWLKITSSGDPVVDVESQWRKPWERLLIAKKKGADVKLPATSKVMLGVPDIHSRKPNLRSLFRGVLPNDYLGLEVFARNLTAGWWGWGNEVLYFQQRHHWVRANHEAIE
ncbi:MT-A70-domain-containing protein [Biscogniauxia mediterranea]|nr:MT-A70-domain-containing protein [Biscogniauxia mediterranea]